MVTLKFKESPNRKQFAAWPRIDYERYSDKLLKDGDDFETENPDYYIDKYPNNFIKVISDIEAKPKRGPKPKRRFGRGN